MRRRIRKSARTRDALARELGTLIVEMQRLGRRNDELLARKAREVAALDDELQGLRAALGRRETRDQVVAAGIAGACESCGTLLGTEDRFCSRCGKPAGDGHAQTEPPPPPPPPPSQLRLETTGADRT
jgi:hypothetical protein